MSDSTTDSAAARLAALITTEVADSVKDIADFMLFLDQQENTPTGITALLDCVSLCLKIVTPAGCASMIGSRSVPVYFTFAIVAGLRAAHQAPSKGC